MAQVDLAARVQIGPVAERDPSPVSETATSEVLARVRVGEASVVDAAAEIIRARVAREVDAAWAAEDLVAGAAEGLAVVAE